MSESCRVYWYWVREVRPRWVVNAAAHTAVDKAESEPELAYAINAEAVKAIGEEARKEEDEEGGGKERSRVKSDGAAVEPFRGKRVEQAQDAGRDA